MTAVSIDKGAESDDKVDRRRRVSTTDNVDKDQQEALESIRSFIKSRTSYDVLPVSFRLIILDTSLLVKRALSILLTNNIVSAPLWNSQMSTFNGLLTASDFINVIQYYYKNASYPQAIEEIEQFKLDGLREVERKIGAVPPETVSINPTKSLYEACAKMVQSRARRIPLIDQDERTGKEMVVSVVTQYRILKFIAVNCKETKMLRKPLSELPIGTYDDLATADLNTPVIDVIHALSEKGIASLPIVDSEGILLNVYEAVDVLTLVRAGDYHDLELTVGEALLRRSDEFEGVHTCTPHDRLDGIFHAIRRSRLHRLVVVDEAGRLKGMLTLSDIMSYLLFGDEGPAPNLVGGSL